MHVIHRVDLWGHLYFCYLYHSLPLNDWNFVFLIELLIIVACLLSQRRERVIPTAEHLSLGPGAVARMATRLSSPIRSFPFIFLHGYFGENSPLLSGLWLEKYFIYKNLKDWHLHAQKGRNEILRGRILAAPGPVPASGLRRTTFLLRELHRFPSDRSFLSLSQIITQRILVNTHPTGIAFHRTLIEQFWSRCFSNLS